MLKRIDTRQVRAGMFVEVIEGAWDSNPLQKRRFLLDSDTAVRLRNSNVSGIVINTAKGTDVSSAQGGEHRVAELTANDRLKLDAAAAFQTVQNSSALLGDMFLAAGNGGPVSFDETAVIANEISRSIDHNPVVFISVTRLKSKDETTFVHSVAVSALMIHFARYLGMDEPTVQLLGVAGLLHDVGKIEIPGDILNKEGALDEIEMQKMRDHPMLGHTILSRQPDMPETVLDICLHHHERMDGKGYPQKLSAPDLSLFVRLSSICDVYDAITSARPYKKPWSANEALSWMLKREGQFDKQLLRKFALCLSVAAPAPV
jgi:putative nucleotidyltransferase with HDIG domain